MAKSTGGTKRIRKSRTDDGSDYANAMIPGIPMPSPWLCLLNSRSPSCLYGMQHERAHQLRLARAHNPESDETSDDRETVLIDDSKIVIPYEKDIKEELKTYEELLSYIALRLSNKRNALDLLSITAGDMCKDYNVLVRSASYGVPSLPVESLLERLQARTERKAPPNEMVPSDLSGTITEKRQLQKQVSELMSAIMTRCKEERVGTLTRESINSKDAKTFKSISHLPLIDSQVLSVISPNATVLPDDNFTLGQWLHAGKDKRSSSNDKDTSKTPNKDNAATDDKQDKTEERLSSGQSSPRSSKNRSQNKCQKTSASSKAPKNQSHDSYKAYHKQKSNSSVDEVRSETPKDDTESPSILNPRKLTETQMLENLRNGKLCDGSEPMDAKDFVMSFIAAGLYEYLSVEFFNEFLQDRRLTHCFDQEDKEGGD
ncbi:hypothetical protein BgAZ_108670 [Babesia gibsoni]|uniref:Uncharacterized protein n=1 Tax=Babesia gibsoni TaxID=33632 RepID=A0AAD8PGK1_BABGI|nr:hypothetical protein BgAZ_108670 [Babesia gibsoni]